VHLLVEEQPTLVDVPVEVDGELWDAGQRLVQQDQHDLAVAPHQPAGQAQIAVEPGVHEGAAVDLDRQLSPADVAGVRVGLDPQVRRVGVGAHDPEPCRRRRVGGRAPGHERAAPLHEAAAAHVRPRLALVQTAEAGLLEAGDGVGHGVVRRRRGVQVGEEGADGLGAGHGRSQAGGAC
jgi:hypothetical protein